MARERHFVKYTFLKVDPAWRRLDAEERAEHKREFIAACEDFAGERLLRAFSTVGTRGDADMMLLTQATNLDRIHEFHVVLAAERADEVVRDPVLLPGADQGVRVLRRVAPRGAARARASTCSSTRSSRRASGTCSTPTSAGGSCRSTSSVGREFPSVDLNTSYSFGLDDQEFVVAFETDEPRDFLDLVQQPAHDGVLALHQARHADVHLHLHLGRAGARRAGRQPAHRDGRARLSRRR